MKTRDIASAPAGGGTLAMGEEFLHAVLDTVASLVLVLDREGRIVLFNRACERVSGYTFEEVRGRHPWDMLLLPEDVDRVRAVFGKLQAGHSTSYDNCWRTKDGHVREIAWTNTILGDERGEVRWVVPTGIDVTERRAVERHLIENENRYDLLFDRANDAIFVCDGSEESGYQILDANEHACRRLQYTRAELLRKRMQDLHPQEDWAPCSDAMQRLRAAGGIIFETAEQRRDGTLLPAEVSAHLFEVAGREAVLAISRDLSERRRFEEMLSQASKLEAIGRLASGVAHDFNNLLVVILCGADAVRAALPEQSALRSEVEEILHAGRRAASLTQQLTAFGRRRLVRPAALDVNGIVDDMKKLMERLVGEDVRLETRLSAESSVALVDTTGLQQVIVNLVVNARDAMPAGGTITIATELADVGAAAAHAAGMAAGRYVVLSVRDTGVGMTAEVRRRIFEPFFSTKAEGRGTGLGLSTVFGVVKQAGGHVLVESTPGAGSVFKVYLPQSGAIPEPALADPRSARPRGDGRTVLLVEDDPAVLGIAVRVLEGDGYTVLAASDPREALRIAEAHSGAIDALLSDVTMPHLDGPELADRLRAARPEIGVVFMSGYSNDVFDRSGDPEPGVLFVAKPFARSDLLDRIAVATRAGCDRSAHARAPAIA